MNLHISDGEYAKKHTVITNAKKAMKQGDKALKKDDLHTAYDTYVLGLELASQTPELLHEEPFVSLLTKLRKLERQVETVDAQQDAKTQLTMRCNQHIERILREGTHRLVKSAYLQLGHELLISGMVSGVEEGDTDMHFGYCDCCGDELRTFDTTHPAWDELEIETTQHKNNDESWQCNVCEESFLYTDLDVLHGEKMFCCDTLQACDWRACKRCQNQDDESHAQLLTHIVARRAEDEPLSLMMDGEVQDVDFTEESNDDSTEEGKRNKWKRVNRVKHKDRKAQKGFGDEFEETQNPLSPGSPSDSDSRKSRESLDESVRGSRLLSVMEAGPSFDVEEGWRSKKPQSRNSRRFNQDMKSLKKGKGKGTGLTRDVDVFESDEYVNPLDSSPQASFDVEERSPSTTERSSRRRKGSRGKKTNYI